MAALPCLYDAVRQPDACLGALEQDRTAHRTTLGQVQCIDAARTPAVRVSKLDGWNGLLTVKIAQLDRA